jgi:putative molybdopterin biosynthesis protein
MKNKEIMSKKGTVTQKARFSRFSAYKRIVHKLPSIANEEFYSAEELSKVLRVNIMTIYRYIKAKKLKAYKIGKEFRIDKNEFNKFLEEVKTK